MYNFNLSIYQYINISYQYFIPVAVALCAPCAAPTPVLPASSGLGGRVGLAPAASRGVGGAGERRQRARQMTPPPSPLPLGRESSRTSVEELEAGAPRCGAGALDGGGGGGAAPPPLCRSPSDSYASSTSITAPRGAAFGLLAPPAVALYGARAATPGRHPPGAAMMEGWGDGGAQAKTAGRPAGLGVCGGEGVGPYSCTRGVKRRGREQTARSTSGIRSPDRGSLKFKIIIKLHIDGTARAARCMGTYK
eukprot:SAG31_NODE_1958_length_6814_cov_3.386597_1_plen_250_part_00